MHNQSAVKPHLRKLVSSLFAFAFMFTTASDDASGETVDHAFEFDAVRDSPGIEILDHRYGESSFPGTRNPEYLVREGRPLQRISVSGPMNRADSLYVKWRVRADGTVHEQTVDLRSRLPRQLEGLKVYFLISGPQLYIYLISQDARPPSLPPNGPRKYRDRKVLTIYPTKSAN